MRNFLSYNSIQFHTYRKLYEISMIKIFPYIFFFEKRSFAYEIRFAVEKNQKKFLGQIFKIEKFFVSPLKKCQSYNFHIWELYDEHFFQKTKTSVFYYQTVLIEWNSYRNKFTSFFNDFYKLYENCMTSIFPHTWCMELYDKHFRCMEVNPGCLRIRTKSWTFRSAR